MSIYIYIYYVLNEVKWSLVFSINTGSWALFAITSCLKKTNRLLPNVYMNRNFIRFYSINFLFHL